MRGLVIQQLHKVAAQLFGGGMGGFQLRRGAEGRQAGDEVGGQFTDDTALCRGKAQQRRDHADRATEHGRL
ncbi:hypothetical protein D3C86_1228180 [compost metagenome]